MAVALIAAILAIVVWAVTAAAAGGKLSANGLVGIRTPATQRSEEAWRSGHRAALRLVAPASAIVALAGLAVGTIRPLARSTGDVAGLVLLGLYVAVLIGAAVLAHRAARRTALPTGAQRHG